MAAPVFFYRADRAAKRFVCSTEEVRLCSALLTRSTLFYYRRTPVFLPRAPRCANFHIPRHTLLLPRLATGAELYQTLPNFGKRFQGIVTNSHK